MIVKQIISFIGFILCSLMILASNLNHDSLFYIVEESDDDSLRVRALISFANDIQKEYPDSAFITLERAEEIAISINNTYLLSVIYSEEGELFMEIHEFARAMEHYFESKSAIESVQDFGTDSLYRIEYIKVLNQIGLIYFQINKFEDALEYFYNMLSFMQEYVNGPSEKVYKVQFLRAYINLGAIYIRTTKYNEAEINYTKALSLLEDDDMLSYTAILNNLGIIAKEQKEYDAAFDYHRRALKIRQEENHLRGQAQSLNNIAATYYILKEYANAKPYFEEALDISLENNLLPSATIALNYLTQIHEKDLDYVKAFEYQSKFQQVNDSLMNQEKLRTITQIEMQDKFDSRVRESQLRQQKMELEQRRLNTLYISFISAALLGIIILVLVFFLQRSKMKRQVLESRKNNLEVKSLELEKVNLERELEFRTKELATNVMYMARTSEFISAISEKLLKSKMYFTKENQELINKIINELQLYVDQDTWTEFELRFQQVHNDFYTKLNEFHSDLTANEKKLCAFLRLNMTTKEISAITYQSANSIIVARSRLRKKLGIERDENLVSYLENL